MDFSASRDSNSADSDSLTAQNANLPRENGVPNKTNVDLLDSFKTLSEKVKYLFSTGLIQDLLAENYKVEKMLLDRSTNTLMTKLCITENGNGTTDKRTENISLDKSPELVGKDKMDVTVELGSELSEQLTNVQQLQRDLNAKTALLKQVTDDLSRKNMALEETEKALSLEKEKSSQREELKKREVDVYDSEIERIKSELGEHMKQLMKLWTLNSELIAELKKANKKVAKSENDLKKVKNLIKETDKDLLLTINLLEAAEDAVGNSCAAF